MRRLARKILRTVANYDPTYYDMFEDRNETFFGQIYLHWIRRHLGDARIGPPAQILDVGCQAGRLTIPLAQAGFDMIGIDTSSFALRRARHHADQVGVSVAWHRADLLTFLARDSTPMFDAIVCAEVLYQQQAYRTMLRALADALRPGGLLFVSHRSQFYYLVEALRHRNEATAQQVIASREGWFAGPWPEAGYYNWQTEDELRALYQTCGLDWIAVYPIDRLAWLSGMSPSTLSEPQREQWLARELETNGLPATFGRYALAVTARPLGEAR